VHRRTLNLGILAHVDAGKTTLTERLLYAAHVIDELGSVDAGTTQTDTLALERRRGITIKSAVASFEIGDVTVNLIDTPGHPDFIAEVERVLSVLDGAVLVISAVEGVQAQTLLLMRALQRLRVPTLLFVNKIDRLGADEERTLRAIAERLTPAAVPPGAVLECLAENDEALLAAYVDGPTVPAKQLRLALAGQTRALLVHPVFFGSALTGAGVDELAAGIAELLPGAAGDDDAPLRATVFKIDRGPAGDRIAYVRVHAGTIRVRDRLDEGKVTAIRVFENGRTVVRASVAAGQIAQLWGLPDVRIGDTIGAVEQAATSPIFAPPTLETVVAPRRRNDKAALHAALLQLAEQDPLIDLQQDDERDELSLSLYGEVQKEVIAASLADDFGVEVEFRETTPICVERPIGAGAAVVELSERSNPFLAGIGLRVEPAAPGSGVTFAVDVPIRSVPLYVYGSLDEFAGAVEETVRATLRQGLSGWQVVDCTVTITHSGYSAPGTGAGDFKKLTPLVLGAALLQAGTQVCEPIHRLVLEGPLDALRAALRMLAQLRAEVHRTMTRATVFVLEGEIAAPQMHLLQQQLRALTHGEGVLEFMFDRYEPVAGAPPVRTRSGPNPYNREEYLLRLARRVGEKRHTMA
jgi:ribosomal protection tetracycline resistance protein